MVKTFIKAYLSAEEHSEVKTLPRGALPQQEERIQALIERDEWLDGSAGIDARGTYEAWQQFCSHDCSIEERTKKWHLWTPK